MERKQLSIQEKNGLIRHLQNSGYNEEVITLVKDDLDYGLTKQEIDLYLDKRWDYKQKVAYSRCLREGYGEEVISSIIKECYEGSRMMVALEFYQKGIPLATIQKVITSSESPMHMKRTFDRLLSEMEQAKQSAESEETDRAYAMELVEKIEAVVRQIQFQEERYDELNQKLKLFESTKEDEIIRENLVKKLADTEANLDSQQDQLNQANATVARLREQVEEKKREIGRMERRIDTLEDKLVEMARVSATATPTPPPITQKSEAVNEEANVVEEVPQEKVEEPMKKSVVFGADMPATPVQGVPVTYQAQVVDGKGNVVQHVPVERTVRKAQPTGLAGFFSKLCFTKKSRQDIVKLVASKDLVPAQLVQIRSAMERGLTEKQLVELINNNVSAEKMKEIIEIAVLENSMEG